MNTKRKAASTRARPVAKTATTASRRKMSGFDAGKGGRRLRAIPASRTAINTLIRTYGKNVVARSRYLCSNNPYAVSAKEEFIAYMVGTGITPMSQVKSADLKSAIQDAFLMWTDEADADSLTDFYGMQGLIAGEMFEAGECFIRIRQRYVSDGFTVPMQLQLIPTEMLPTEFNWTLSQGRRVECGIQFDALGRREGYYFLKYNPGEDINSRMAVSSMESVFVPADEVLHLYRPIRAGQIRGLPQTLGGMVTLAMLDLYDDAELERKRLAALFGAFITKGLGSDDDDANPLAGAPAHTHIDAHGNNSTTGQVNFALEPGATIELDYGQDVKFAEPADVGGNYEAFQKRMLLRASAGMGATYHGMTGDTSGASFSTMRADQLRYRRRIEAQQHHIMVFQFCRKVFNKWMDAAVSVGAIDGLNARDYVKTPKVFQQAKWTPPKWEWVDPLKDIMAEKMAVDAGFKPRSAVIVAQGEDPIDTDNIIAQDQQRASDLKLKFVTTNTSVLVAPTADDQEEVSTKDPNAPAPAPGGPQPAPAPAPKPAPGKQPPKGK